MGRCLYFLDGMISVIDEWCAPAEEEQQQEAPLIDAVVEGACKAVWESVSSDGQTVDGMGSAESV